MGSSIKWNWLGWKGFDEVRLSDEVKSRCEELANEVANATGIRDEVFIDYDPTPHRARYKVGLKPDHSEKAREAVYDNKIFIVLSR